MTAVSPLAPANFPHMPPVAGVRLACRATGIRYQGRTDLFLAEFRPGTTVAGVFTQSACAAAPVIWCRTAIQDGRARALVVNAGNANAFTGRLGDQAVERTAIAAASLFGCPSYQVLISSTGVIGVPLPAERLVSQLPMAANQLTEGGWQDAARTISTTDTFFKGATSSAQIDGTSVVINGIAKGAGMIAPDLATMLVFIFTDAAIEAPVLQAMTQAAAHRSFDCITVDGDTSTNDTVLVFATGAAGHAPIAQADDPRAADFVAALKAVMIDLAQQIVRDGEGATKFVTIDVKGAANDEAARQIALTIANSPLVKTAVAGSDANWGRIAMAIGRARQKINLERMTIAVGGFLVATGGGPVPDYDETPVARHMQGQEIGIDVDVGVGGGKATVWTCDLTHGYIDINASYRS